MLLQELSLMFSSNNLGVMNTQKLKFLTTQLVLYFLSFCTETTRNKSRVSFHNQPPKASPDDLCFMEEAVSERMTTLLA